MSNLKSAKLAIAAELEHARQGAAFYQSRVDALEDAMSKLDSVDAGKRAPGKAGMESHIESTKKTAKAGRKPRAKAAASTETDSDGDKLPSTGKDFWPSLIDDQPKSAAEIFDAAVKALGITPTQGQTKKLLQRQANALSILTKNGAISSSGSGRSRRFFR